MIIIIIILFYYYFCLTPSFIIKPILLNGSQILLPHTPLFTKLSSTNLEPANYFQVISRDTHELFHLRYLEWVLGVHRKASITGTYGELGRLPLIFDGFKLTCDYFERCELLPNDSLVKKAFLEQQHLDLDWHHNITMLRWNFSVGNSKLVSINVYQNQRTHFIENFF